ncbi:MAG: outer membrane protein assembly factor BamA, partial [Bacteroidaceae bacterium]|nr:outer membrane protein assembly factor BamA [Bacteroidaceae bacterium]
MIKLQEMIYNPLRMVKAISLIRVAALLLLILSGSAELLAQANKVVNPAILYSGTPRKYVIGGINLTGIENQEPYVIIGLSNLSVGDEITVPGEAITAAVKRYWQFGLFSDVSITADSIIGSKIYLGIHLKQSPR